MTTTINLPTSFFDQLEVAALGHEAQLLLIAAACHTIRRGLDGRVPTAFAAGLGLTDPGDASARLVAGGWWQPSPGGWRFDRWPGARRRRAEASS